MIRMIPKRRIRIPHLAAVIAAGVLLAASLVGGSQDHGTGELQAPNNTVSVSQGGSSDTADTPERKRKLSISMFLFGNG